ncbi:MAG: YceH family protein [Acidobacteriota bacterium]
MPLPRQLDPIEIRVLGALLEKQQTTPEYYPLTLNALLAACNQKSNREPMMELAEREVRAALDRLHAEMLVWPSEGARVPRWEHTLDRRLDLDAKAKALLTALFLRGAQTPGELRTRTERMVVWGSRREVEDTLSVMAAERDGLVVELHRQPGQKETRWMTTVGGPPAEAALAEASSADSSASLAERVAQLEERVTALAARLEELVEQLRDE